MTQSVGNSVYFWIFTKIFICSCEITEIYCIVTDSLKEIMNFTLQRKIADCPSVASILLLTFGSRRSDVTWDWAPGSETLGGVSTLRVT